MSHKCSVHGCNQPVAGKTGLCFDHFEQQVMEEARRDYQDGGDAKLAGPRLATWKTATMEMEPVKAEQES